MLAEGDTALSAGRLEEAISKFRASYYGLSATDQASYLGSLPVRKAMRAYEQKVEKEQDPAKRRSLFEQQRVLLNEFLGAVAAREGAAEEVGEDVIAELEAVRSSIDDALAEHKGEPETIEHDVLEPVQEEEDGAGEGTIADPGDEPLTSAPPKSSRDGLGLGLVIGGGTTFLVGAGVTIGYFTIRSGAEALVNAGGEEYAPGTQAREDYLEKEYARARPFLIAGSVVAGVGLAVAVGGTIRLVLHQRRSEDTTALRLSPVLAPTTVGLVLRRRF